MQKLKKVFSPGKDKDDEQMYGSPETRRANVESGHVGEGLPSATPNQLIDSTSAGKDHGISRQILNPGGDKYDEQRFGPASTTQPGLAHTTGEREAATDTIMGEQKEDRSVKRKVLDPENSKRDETGYGSTEFNPSATSTTQDPSSRPNMSDAASGLSMKSGVLGSPDQHAEERALRSDGITSDNTSRNAALTGAGAAAGAGAAYAATRGNDNIEDPAHTDRSFPLRGGAVVPQSDNRPTSSVYSAETAGPTSTSASAVPTNLTSINKGTAGGSAATSGDDARANLGLARHSAIDHSGHSHQFKGDPCETEPGEKTLAHIHGPHATVAANMLDPHVPGEFPREDGTDPHGSPTSRGAGWFGQGSEPSDSTPAQPSEPSQGHHYGRDAAVVGGVGAAGALGAHALHDRNTPAEQSPSLATTEAPRGPSPAYPEPLGSHEAMSDRSPLAQESTLASTQPGLASTHDYPAGTQPEAGHHYGRDAALVGGGAGVAGLGAYAATRDHEPKPLDTSTSSPSMQQTATSPRTIQSTSPQHVAGNPLTGARERTHTPVSGVHGTSISPQQRDLSDPIATQPDNEKEHHYVRNAALAGGAGAAGYAGYSALQHDKESDNTGPASKTIGPHSSNIANIVDPRVRPEPEKMKEHTTSGPWQSDTLNKLDPKVESDPSKADVKAHGYASGVPTQPVQQQQQQPVAQDKDHHYGRDATLVGGGGAAAYGASQLYDNKHQDPTTSGVSNQPLQQQQQPLAQDKDHHYGRDAALVGGSGAAAYGASQAYNNRDQTASAVPNHQQQLQQSPLAQNKEPEHHYGRDAALVGGGGAAAYGASQLADDNKPDEKALAKEREKLAKEHEKAVKEQEKQAQHDAKEQAKEAEKQAKHDAKEADKQAKHDAHEAEKARKKEEEKAAKEQEKAAKEHAKEHEKLEKQQSKEAEKAEEKRLKEQEKLDKDREKENAKLAAARADEAEAKHKEHNKLHKDPPEEREKKDGIFHRIFHHKQYEREGSAGAENAEEERLVGGDGVALQSTATNSSANPMGKSSFEQPGMGGEGDGMVTEPHTGLPMNVGKYGSGAGGTDAGEHIAGYHAK